MRLLENMKNTSQLKMWRKRKNKKRISEPDFFLISVYDVYLTNVTNKTASKLKKNQAHIALKFDTTTQACLTLKKEALNVTFRCECWLEALSWATSQAQAIKYGFEFCHTNGQPNTDLSWTLIWR